MVQSELEIQEEELKNLKGQYIGVEEELVELKQKFREWQDYISEFDVQMNIKIVELDMEQDELPKARDQI